MRVPIRRRLGQAIGGSFRSREVRVLGPATDHEPCPIRFVQCPYRWFGLSSTDQWKLRLIPVATWAAGRLPEIAGSLGRAEPRRVAAENHTISESDRTAVRTDEKKIASMAEEARELAARGYYPFKIEAVLKFYGFLEAAEWIGQAQIQKELKEIAERARRSDQIKWNALPPS